MSLLRNVRNPEKIIDPNAPLADIGNIDDIQKIFGHEIIEYIYPRDIDGRKSKYRKKKKSKSRKKKRKEK